MRQRTGAMVGLGVLGVMVLASQLGPYADGTVVITSSVASPEVRRPARILSSFLRDRIFESYGFSAGVTPSEVTQLQVRLYFGQGGQLSLTVLDDDGIRGARNFERGDPEATMFETWIFLRAVLEEALPLPEPEPPPPIASTPTSSVPASVAASPAAPAPAAATTTLAAPRSQGQLAFAALAFGAIGGPEGLGLGLAIQGRVPLAERLSGTLELGYRRADPLATLSVAHLPISAMFGYQLDASLPLEVGARATLDPRLVVEQDTGDVGLGLGLGVGPYARVAVPFESVAFVGQLDVQAGLLRQAYQVGGERAVDPVLSVQVSLGVEYQWP